MKKLQLYNFSKGFTLMELLVAIAIVGIMSAVIFSNTTQSSAKSRDAKRQTDLVNLQVAIEAYRQKEGKYPPQCATGSSADGWSGQTSTVYVCTNNTNNYIEGLVPNYIKALPVETRLNGTNSGYVYRTNGTPGTTGGTVYKIKAQRTVESETVNFSHPMKACDVRVGSQSDGSLSSAYEEMEIIGWCGIVHDGSGDRLWDSCKSTDSQWYSSYGLWGGFAPLFPPSVQTLDSGSFSQKRGYVRNTTGVICR